METTTLFLKPCFSIAVQPSTGELAVQVEATKKPLASVPTPLQLPVVVRWLSRH
jgi:hypothetical protein